MTEKNKWKLIKEAPESRREFDKYVREMKNLPVPVECKHEKTIYLEKCLICGQIWKIKKQ